MQAKACIHLENICACVLMQVFIEEGETIRVWPLGIGCTNQRVHLARQIPEPQEPVAVPDVGSKVTDVTIGASGMWISKCKLQAAP